jgi:hypothetical protein
MNTQRLFLITKPLLRRSQRAFYSKMTCPQQIKPADRVSHFGRDGKFIEITRLEKKKILTKKEL